MKSRLARFAPLILALSLGMTLPAKAAEVPLVKLSDYINSLVTAEAAFVQQNADGTKSKGRIYIQRPGRARFEYEAPSKDLVLATSGQVVIFDARSNQPPEVYPLARTPLNLILARAVDLTDARMVVGHAEVDGQTVVRAQDPNHPEYGSIDLYFSAEPVALVKWVITDDIGNQTVVTLDAMETGKDYPMSLFSKDAELKKRVK